MKILLAGRWGKAHAVGRALVKDDSVELYSFMDKKNPGIAEISTEVHIGDLTDRDEILSYAQETDAELVFVSPEMSLKTGVTDLLMDRGIPAVGPTEFCSRLESDKLFVRNFLKRHNLDMSPHYRAFFGPDSALEYINSIDRSFAVKPAGVTEGDGVKVIGIQLESLQDARGYIREIFDRGIGGLPYIIIEDKIEGEEFTLQGFVDGRTVVPMPATRDYKLLEEGDRGLNTPGMGSYSASDHLLPFLNSRVMQQSLNLMQKTVDIMREEYDEEYRGILSGQFMLTGAGLRLIEFNVRAGDSEILNIIPILKTPMTEILTAITEQRLNSINIEYDHKATVCKYLVPPGFPEPEGPVRVDFDPAEIENGNTMMFQSCFQAGDGLYQPSPRTFAVTGTGDTITEAKINCEEGLDKFEGEGLRYRKDIGSGKLTESYMESLKIPPVTTTDESISL